jgi:geranylgeranyl diphosphate synthase type II
MNLTKSALLVLMLASSASGFTRTQSTPKSFVAPVFSSLKEKVTIADDVEKKDKKFDLVGYFKSNLPALEEAMLAATKSDTAQTENICKSMEYSLMAGGKRLRPMLCIAACEMFGGSVKDAIPTAIALEMIHTMSLIHDDLPMMDNDDLRRGKPTNHVVFGEQVAILAGDAMLAGSFEVVATNTPESVPARRVVDVISILGKAMGPVGLAGGQAMDLECEAKEGVTIEDLTWIHTHKTAALLEASICAGATLGGATKEEVEALRKFSIDIGLAFQIADDILDITATTEELGKTAAKDLDADKTTYPKLLGLEESKAEAQRLIDEAKALVEPFGDKAIPLLAMADFIVSRKN